MDMAQSTDARSEPRRIPAVIYASRSQAEEPGKDSTGSQVALIRDAIERHPDRFVYGEPHVDHASGFRGNRGPALEAAMREAEQAVGEYEQAELWVYKSERLGRGSGRKDEARSVMEVYVEMRRAGVDLRSVEDDAFLTNPMLVGVADQMANKYSEDLKAHVRRGLNDRAGRGLPHGTPGLGYAYSEPTDEDRAEGRLSGGHWAVEPAEAATVQRIFRMYVEHGQSYSGIAKTLNAERVRTRSGAAWAPVVIRKLVASQHTLGKFRHRSEWHDGRHEPIIDRETWDAAQLLSERGRKYAPKGSPGRLPKNHVFVRGALRCGACGAAMLPRSQGSREWYACRTRTETGGAAACSMPVIPRQAVDSAALGMFESTALDVEATRRHVAEQLTARVDETRAQVTRAERDAAEIALRLARVERDYLSKELGAANYERLSAQLREGLAAAEAERDQLTARAETMTATLADLDAEHETFRRLADLRATIARRVNDTAGTGDVPALRAAWARVFDVAYVVPGRVFSNMPGLVDGPPERMTDLGDVRIGDDPDDLPHSALFFVPVVRSEMLAPSSGEDRSGIALGDILARSDAEPVHRVALGLTVQDRFCENETGTQVLDQMTTRPA